VVHYTWFNLFLNFTSHLALKKKTVSYLICVHKVKEFEGSYSMGQLHRTALSTGLNSVGVYRTGPEI